MPLSRRRRRLMLNVFQISIHRSRHIRNRIPHNRPQMLPNVKRQRRIMHIRVPPPNITGRSVALQKQQFTQVTVRPPARIMPMRLLTPSRPNRNLTRSLSNIQTNQLQNRNHMRLNNLNLTRLRRIIRTLPNPNNIKRITVAQQPRPRA